MRHDLPEPAISPDFTIEDIHRIREWNYECQKGMTPAERAEDTARLGEDALSRLGLSGTVKRLRA
jgi:hypothetical protein